MRISYAYNCVKAEIKKDLGLVNGSQMLVCDLQFVTEHGHELAAVTDVLVAVADGSAHLEKYPENILPEDHPTTGEEWQKWEKLCENHPGYDVYNGEELATMLRHQPRNTSTTDHRAPTGNMFVLSVEGNAYMDRSNWTTHKIIGAYNDKDQAIAAASAGAYDCECALVLTDLTTMKAERLPTGN